MSRGRAGLLALICGALSCTEPHPADLTIEIQSTPFYLVEERPIYLRLDPRLLTVEADSSILPELSASLAVSGVTVDSTRALGSVFKHWVFWLHPPMTTAAAVAAAQKLRRHAGVRFASNAYVSTIRTDCSLRLINRFDVQYKASTTPEQITELHERAGLRVEREPRGRAQTAWRLRYPTGNPYTPLEIGAAIYRHPYVDWASPDMVGYGCVYTLSGG